jgi:tyrosyl-DNA phosphodiesterase 1
MCQAVWRSPLLPKQSSEVPSPAEEAAPPFGTGARFQFDIISYLKAYGNKLQELSGALRSYDFSTVKACLIASTPSRQSTANLDIKRNTIWGWPGLNHSVKQIPNLSASGGFYVAQVSSIATLGVNPTWLNELCRAMQGSSETTRPSNAVQPNLSIVFPTADEIRRSIDGYSCGGSIHMKLQTAANQKQLKYLIPHLCHWAGDEQHYQSSDRAGVKEAGRKRTGPHIKTYLRFTDAEMTRLDWGMITSANLSKQAWGTDGSGTQGEVRISSFEIGVLFWPEMWKEGEQPTRMIPTFKKDTPDQGEERCKGSEQWNGIQVGWRMPYDLPLVPYSEKEEPWCATKPHLQPDWRGGVWTG